MNHKKLISLYMVFLLLYILDNKKDISVLLFILDVYEAKCGFYKLCRVSEASL